MRRAIVLVLVILFSLGIFWLVLAQSMSFTQPKWTVDNGGGKASGTNYTLYSTVGQPDVGVANSANYQLQSGFWHSAEDRVLVLYALALDNLATSNGNLASYYADVVQALLNATRDDSSKIAVLLVDLNGSADHVLVIANGQRHIRSGLPDKSTDCEALTVAKNEFDMTNGEELGCFIQWARGNYRASKTVFSYVGHGVALAPAVENFYCIVNGLEPPCSQPSSAVNIADGTGLSIVPTYKAVNPDWTDHHPEEGIVEPRLITPHALATALRVGTDNGNNPLDVVDITHCFAVSIEEFYELSFNPDDEQKPYAQTLIGSPNYTYFAPELLATFLSTPQLEQEASAMAEDIIAAYEVVLETADDSDDDPDVDHPRVMVAVASSEIPAIKQAMDDLATELLLDNNFDAAKIMAAYTNSAKYDTTFCQGDWDLAPPDALSDIGSFTQEVVNQFGANSSVTAAANIVKERVNAAVITHTLTNGKPWFADIEPLPDWDFGDPNHTLGIGGYLDFQGITKTGEITTYVSFQSPWYTSTIHPKYPQIPYGSVIGPNKTWADLFYRLLSGRVLQPELCLPEFPPLQRVAELSVERIVFPLDIPAMVSVGSPTQLSAAIHTENIAPNPLVEFVVTTSDGAIVFTNTVSAGYLVTGTHQVNASEFWIPDASSVNRTFTMTVTVDPNGERFIDPEPDNNVGIQEYQFPIEDEYPRPMIIVTNNSGQWVSENEISLTIEQTSGDEILGIWLDTYVYEAESPNTQIAQQIHHKKVPDFLPGQDITLSLTSDLGLLNSDGTYRIGAVELHVWGLRGGNPSVAVPSIVKFNHVPLTTTISTGAEHYYLFDVAEVGEHIHLDLTTNSGDANMFVWDPLNLWNPTAQATSTGTDFIDFHAPIAGQYVLMVRGEPTAEYTLSAAESGTGNFAIKQSPQQAINLEAYIPARRPVFLPPIPQLPPKEIYLPFVANNFVSAPDLIIQQVDFTEDDIQVVIKNQGSVAVNNAFWVDLYIDPDPIPTEVDQICDNLGGKGLVWIITDASSLTPNGTLTLNLNYPGYLPGVCEFNGTFTSNMTIYLQVDSTNAETDYGAVLESHELSGGPYNNVFGPVSPTENVVTISTKSLDNHEEHLTGIPTRSED